MKRVVITGAGTINALGHTVGQTLQAMREGTCGIGLLEVRDIERLSVQIGITRIKCLTVNSCHFMIASPN
jgi:nodulation protein E